MTGKDFLEEGWKSCEFGQFPVSDQLIEFARDEQVYWQPNWFGRWCDLDPAFNIAGLWWRPA